MLTAAELERMRVEDAQQRAQRDGSDLAIRAILGDGDDLDLDSSALLAAMDNFEVWLSNYTRSWDPAKHPRNPPGSPGGGRFLSAVDHLTAKLKEHHAAGGKGGDPFEGYSREQLRRVAKKRGIELKRGESRDDIAKKLLDHLGAAKPNIEAPKPKAPKGKPLSGRKALEAAPIKLGIANFQRGVEGDLAQEIDPDALSMYRAEGYQIINDDLRAGDWQDWQGSESEWAIRTIDTAMEHSKLTHDVVVHRGVKDMDLFRGVDTSGSLVGLEYIEDAYSSTTADKAVTEDFWSPGGAIINLRVPAGIGAIQLSDFQAKNNPFGEAELLLQRGLRIRITGDRDIGSIRELDAEVVSA